MQRTPPRKETAGPLRSAPSSTPYDAMNTSQQAHIDDLVQKNRTLEHMCKKFREDFAKVETRHKEQLGTLQQKWTEERVEWREGCDAVQSAHKVAHLRTAMLLDAERRAVLAERDAMRLERLAWMQRDYKIVLFQMNENAMEIRLEELQEELDDYKASVHHEKQRLLKHHQQIVQNLKDKCTSLISKMKERETETEQTQTERTAQETELVRLREEVNNLNTTNSSLTTSLERKSLQLDGAKSDNDELERLNAELKRSNADLKRQVDKWQSLETKEGNEMDKLRKRRMELEVQVKELESRLADSEKQTNANKQASELTKAKYEKIKSRLQEYIEALTESNEAVQEHQEQIAQLDAKLTRADQKIERLRLEVSAARLKEVTRSKSPTTYIQGTDEDEQSQTMRPPPSRPKPRPTFKGKQAIERTGTKLKTEREKMVEENSDIEELEQIPQRKRKATYSDVEKREKPQKIADESGSDVEMTRKGKGKKKVEHDSDAEMIRAGKGKAKATDQTDDEAVEGKTRKRDRAKTGAASGSEDVGPPTKKKSASRAPSKQPPKASASVQEIGDKGDGDPKPTKKRKIRIFNPAQPPMFSFNLNNTSALNGLDIPTELSPVKEGDLVPPRSIFSKSGSVFK